MQHVAIFDTLTSGAQKVGVPPSTVRDLERRRVIGPFARDAAGRRLLTSHDLEQIRQYLASRCAP